MPGRNLTEILIALKRLADDQRGKPESEAALAKIKELQAKYPELKLALKPLYGLTMGDIRLMHKSGISTDGSWTGVNLDDALRIMQEDYIRRIVAKFPGETLEELRDMMRKWGAPKEMLEDGENEAP